VLNQHKPWWAGSFEAIGVENRIVVDTHDALAPALEIARVELDELDRACSRFRDDSDLAAVNRGAGADVAVGPLLLAVVEAALRVSEATDGLVDPTVGPALDALGYDRDFRLVAGSGPRAVRLVPAAGWRRVLVDRRDGTIRIPRGAELDLGAVAKAFSADRIAARVHAATGASALASLGGDVAVAGAPPGGWAVTIADDHRNRGSSGPTVAVADGGLATSSTAVRRWRAAGHELHHIVDPATGRPADEHWRTVSVAASTCVDANAAATAAIVMGEDAPEWLDGLGLAARLVRPDGTVTHTSGWPEGAG
jgi:thiamine biosynthesis lipoprotein